MSTTDTTLDAPLEQTDFLKSLAEKSDSGGLRGDYAAADRHYVVAQNWRDYTPAQHALWRKLYQRQAKLLPGRACEVFIDSLRGLDASQGIPDFQRTSALLCKATRWQLVAVPGLVPDVKYRLSLSHPLDEELGNGQSPLEWPLNECVLTGSVLETVGIQAPVLFPEQSVLIMFTSIESDDV